MPRNSSFSKEQEKANKDFLKDWTDFLEENDPDLDALPRSAKAAKATVWKKERATELLATPLFSEYSEAQEKTTEVRAIPCHSNNHCLTTRLFQGYCARLYKLSYRQSQEG